MALRAWLASASAITVGFAGVFVGALNASAATTTTVIEDTSLPASAYTGTWAKCTTNCAAADDNSFQWTSTPGSALSFSLTGTQIDLYGMKEPWANIATISIDNGPTTNVDYYAATATTSTVQVYSSPTLSSGTHTLKLTMTGNRNPDGQATGNSMTFDKAVVTSDGSTTPPPTTGTRLSGLAWSSGVWADSTASEITKFVTTARGGVALDNILVYTSRDSFAAQNNPAGWKAQLPGGKIDGAKQDLGLGLTSLTMDGKSMTYAQGQSIGTSLCGIDSTPIVRLDWEMNLPDSFPGENGAALTAANMSTWTARFNNVATGIKNTCSGTRIDFNPNHGGDQTAGCTGTTCTRQAFQAVKANVDIYGVDTYDSWPPSRPTTRAGTTASPASTSWTRPAGTPSPTARSSRSPSGESGATPAPAAPVTPPTWAATTRSTSTT